MREKFDIIFLGGGPAGYQGAIRAAQLGTRVAVVEEKSLGGVCLNNGCIPTKTVRASAEVGRVMRRAREFGFPRVETVPDMGAVIARKNRVVSALRGSIAGLFRANGIILVEAHGQLTDSHIIELERDGQIIQFEAEKIVITTGSRPAEIPVFPKHPRIFPSDDLLNLTYLPRQLLVVGGGAVGIELAAIFQELGSQVAIVEAKERLLSSEDMEMSEYLEKILRRRKVNVICSLLVEQVIEDDDHFLVRLSDGTNLMPDTIVIAAGRLFNTRNLGLEKTGVILERERIVVDKCMRTNIPGIYAAGDVTGNWLLAHVAFAEGICAAEHAIGLGSEMDYRVVPRCVFTLPEYAAVGISEAEAEKEKQIKVARFPFKSLGIGLAMGEFEGFIKIIADAGTDRILGAHVIGPHASELVAEIAIAMRANLPSKAIMDTIHTHPSLSEGVLEVAQALHGQAIHSGVVQ